MVSKQFLFLICLLISLPLRAAEVTARLQRDPIQVDETVKLIVEIDARWSGAGPQLEPLKRDFEILGSSRGSQVKIVNGSVSASTRWTIELGPRHAGTLTIPPIRLGKQRTPALTLHVLTGGPGSATARGRAVFLEARATPAQPYVGQQIRYTLRLFHSADLIDGSLGEPRPENANVRRLGKDVTYSTTRGGHRYEVIERRYALFARRSGTMRVPSVSFNGRISAPAVDPFGGGAFGGLFNRGRRVRARSAPLTLTVRPPPATFGGSDWLPAQEFTVSDQWSTDPDTLKVGDAVTRTVTLLATGVEAAQLPAPSDLAPAGVKSYPDQPKLETTSDARNVRGSRVQRVALLATRAGTVTAPEIRIRWWDVTRDAERTVVIPARTLHIVAGVARQPQPPSPAPRSAAPSPTPRSLPAPPLNMPAPATASGQSSRWQLLSAALFGVWLVTLGAWWRSARKQRNAPVEAPHPGTGASPRETRRELDRACRANDPRAARAALLKWGRSVWPATPPRSLPALAARIEQPELAAALAALDRALYSPGMTSWDGDRLREASRKGLRLPAPAKPSKSAEDGLPELYP